jgi:hypothetical protein
MNKIEKAFSWVLKYWWVLAGILMVVESYLMVQAGWRLEGVWEFGKHVFLLFANALAFDVSYRYYKDNEPGSSDAMGIAIALIIVTSIASGFRGLYVIDRMEETPLGMQTVEIVNMADDKGVVLYHFIDSNETLSVVSSETDKGDYFKVKSDYMAGNTCFIEDINYTYPTASYNYVGQELNCYQMRD